MTDPIDDETKPHDTGSTQPTFDDQTAPAGRVSTGTPPAATQSDAAPSVDAQATGSYTPGAPDLGLRADPDRPADSGWREPAWFPPRDKDRGPSIVAVIVGLVLIAIGLYYFLDRTLGVTMPRIQWSTVWPILLIGLGAIVIFRSVSRRS